MARKRAARGAASSTDQAFDGNSPEGQVRDPDPTGRSHAELIGAARQSLIEAVPGSAAALAGCATDGSVTHIKLLFQLVGLDGGQLASAIERPRERTREEIDMEAWNRET
jgi:hypothetical protein